MYHSLHFQGAEMRIANRRSAGVLILCLVSSSIAFPQAAPALNERRKALASLLDEQWQYTLRTSPLFASYLGDKRWNDKLDDFSQEAIDKDLVETQKFLVRFEAVDTRDFPPQEVLSKELMVRDLKEKLEGARFKSWEMPVDQQNGVQLLLPRLVNILSFQSVKDYEDYISRLNQLPRLLDQNMTQMRKGLNDKLMPPRFLMNEVVEQCKKLSSDTPETSPFAQPFRTFPAAVPEADQKRLREAGVSAVRDTVLPAYARFTAFVRDEYAPNGRTEVGVWSLPNGDAYYAYLAKQSTTTALTPEEIHQLGLVQVKEIEARMQAIARQLGYEDFHALNAAVAADPKLHAHSRQELLDLYRKYIDQMYVKLPSLFGRMPKAKLEVLPVEEFREKEASSASYQAPAPDGSRPGHVMVNTGDFAKRTVIDIETTSYHEGVPGHHMQMALAQELPELPPFRQQEYFTAYTEGWALYSEQLGKEVGFFQDPYSYYGHLGDDMLRAIRLVVDTGLHYKHWTRQQVIDYFHAHSSEDEVDLQSETDRYIAWPGQALGYKIGQLEILKLRQEAKEQLGERFDIRAFHDQVLGAGALPMDVLASHIQAWIGSQKQAASGATPRTSR
jgi:uncharacterized protein (DUF885 family)